MHFFPRVRLTCANVEPPRKRRILRRRLTCAICTLAASMESAVCTSDATDVTEKAHPDGDVTEKRTLYASGGCVERSFSPICGPPWGAAHNRPCDRRGPHDTGGLWPP